MKIKQIILSIIFIVLISCSNENTEIDSLEYVPVDSPQSFRALGFCVVAPNNSSNTKYAIVKKTIAEASFRYANGDYYYRASKNYEDLFTLHNISNYGEGMAKEFNYNEITVKYTVYTAEKERTALWNIKDVYYSLFSEDNDSDMESLARELMANKISD